MAGKKTAKLPSDGNVADFVYAGPRFCSWYEPRHRLAGSGDA